MNIERTTDPWVKTTFGYDIMEGVSVKDYERWI